MNAQRLKNKATTDMLQTDYDYDKPSLPQIYKMGDKYEEWVNQPSPSKDRKKRILVFGGVLEILTVVPEWLPITFWFPIMIYMSYRSLFIHEMRLVSFIGWVISGWFGLWPFVEYVLHRWVFHFEHYSWGPSANVLHWLLHGIHHKSPQDTLRLLAPIPLSVVIAYPVFRFMTLVLSERISFPFIVGGLAGYLCYDYCHLYLHTRGYKPRWWRSFAKKHLAHHQKDHDRMFAVSPPTLFWDKVFGTSESSK